MSKQPDYERIYEPNPADDTPYRHPDWLGEEGWRIEAIHNGHWRKDGSCGPFERVADALAYLQDNLFWYEGRTLRIATRIYKVERETLYEWVEGQGYRPYEGVSS